MEKCEFPHKHGKKMPFLHFLHVYTIQHNQKGRFFTLTSIIRERKKEEEKRGTYSKEQQQVLLN